MHQPRHVLELQFPGRRVIVRGAPQTANPVSPRPQAAEALREGNVRVREIWFNHNPESERPDAVTLLDTDSNRPITTAEWTDDKHSKPAAYTREALTRTITVKVSFSGGRPGETVVMRAISERPGAGRRVGAMLDFLFGPSSVLGTVVPRAVRFGDNGESEFVSFEIRGRRKPPPVGVYQLRWTWQVDRGGRWVDVATTEHKLYMLAAVPAPPWNRAIAAEVSFVPWLAAVELSCQWASGANSVEEATDMIARAINGHPKHIYDPAADKFANNPDNWFDLTKYLYELEHEKGLRIDCRGTAAAVATFANIQGAELFPLSIFNAVPSFMTTKLFRPFTDPYWVQFINWSFHEVAAVPGTIPGPVLAISTFTPGMAWPPRFGEDQVIYDAIPHLNMDAPIPAIRIPVGTVGGNAHHYLASLIDTGADTLQPQLRREVI